ncbi:g4516 [Coccomyxa viridis]|uniref:G4516 protein n=1 Tax=Coccomyxa viridis TaxID=1274662 RepID=A0ABP1FQG8_9CHLO
MLTQAVSLVAVAAAAWYAARLASQQENAEPRQECGVCNGTGVVPCICRRWSDSDVGCATCNGRGMMACSSCGGGGTAVPITAKLIIRRDENDMNRYTGR